MMMQARPSHTKFGGIYVASCDSSLPLYPLDLDPANWRSCHDAYEFTWGYDPDRYLTALSDKNKQKLARSMGYCPHHRCQLGNLSNASDNHCPAGLCYTKLENSALSFGACCFIDGKFNTGGIIGFEDKCQSTAKPIYKKSRIILAAPISISSAVTAAQEDTSYDRFINANMIYPQLIATQCPMQKTVQDVKQMIAQQRVRLWIQLTSTKQLHDPTNPNSKDCLLLTSAFENGTGYEDLSHQDGLDIKFGSASFEKKTFRLTYRDNYVNGEQQQPVEFIDANSNPMDAKKSLTVNYIWFKDWEDFEVPHAKYNQDILNLAETAASVMRDGGTVAINCFSGRGRTGTLAALVLGKLKQLGTHDQFVDRIVMMRESRDGLVETPQQYRYASKLLGLPDTAECELLCSLTKNLSQGVTLSFIVGLLILFGVGIRGLFLKKKEKR